MTCVKEPEQDSAYRCNEVAGEHLECGVDNSDLEMINRDGEVVCRYSLSTGTPADCLPKLGCNATNELCEGACTADVCASYKFEKLGSECPYGTKLADANDSTSACVLIERFEVYYHEGKMVAYLPWTLLKDRCDGAFTYELAMPETDNGLYHFSCNKDVACTVEDSSFNVGGVNSCLPNEFCH
jgi:hypothetical protein